MSNLFQQFPPHTLISEIEASLVALNHPENGLQTLQEQVPDMIPVTPPDQNPVAEAVPAPTQSFVCSGCERGFRRWQDRDRHIRTHLPYSHHCPFPRCPWRCDRPENLTRHWNNTHSEYGPAPPRQQCQIYYTKGLITAILDGALTVEEAAEIALSVVGIKAIELDKGNGWENGWGRRTMAGQ